MIANNKNEPLTTIVDDQVDTPDLFCGYLELYRFRIVGKAYHGEKLTDSRQQIEFFLRTSTRISSARLSEYSNIKIEKVMEHLKKLESERKVIRIEKLKEISCTQCGSVRIDQNFLCPACYGSNFKQGKLIEHFKCGNVSINESYKNNTCPKCSKEIKIIGVDYKTINNYYLCNDCNEKFPEPAQDFICVRCNNRFTLDKAKWVTSEGFKPVIYDPNTSEIVLGTS